MLRHRRKDKEGTAIMTTTQPNAVVTEQSTADIPFNKHRRDWKKTGIIVLFCFLPIALLVVFTYLPFFQMCGYSFYKMKYIGTPKFIGMKNYTDIFTRPDLLATLKLSLYYMVGALIQVALALYLATILAFKVRGGAFFKGGDVLPVPHQRHRDRLDRRARAVPRPQGHRARDRRNPQDLVGRA